MKRSLNVRKLFVKLIVGILVCSFAMWGLGSQMLDRVKGEEWLIKVRSVKYFEKDLEPFIRQAQRNNVARGEVMQNAVDSLMTSALLEQEAKRLNIVVDDSVVARELATSPAFRGDDGKLDLEKFKSFIKGSGKSERHFINNIKKQIAGNQLAHIFNATAGLMPTELTQLMIDAMYSVRVAKLITVREADIGALTISEDDLKSHYAAKREEFMKEEVRKIRYITFDIDVLSNFIGEIAISEEDIIEEYNKRKSVLIEPEKRDVEQMIFADKAEADKAYDEIMLEKSFAEVKKNIKKAMNYGDVIKNIEADGLDNGLSEVIFALLIGDVSKPVKSSLGWHIFKLSAIHAEYVKPLERVRDMIINDVRAAKKYDAFSAIVTKISDEGATIEDLAKDYNLQIKESEVARSQLHSYNDKSKNAADDVKRGDKIAKSASIINAAFDIDLQQTSDILPVLGYNNTYAMIFVERIDDAYVPNFDKIAADVRASYEQEQKERIAKDAAGLIREALLKQKAEYKLSDVAVAKFDLAQLHTAMRREIDADARGATGATSGGASGRDGISDASASKDVVTGVGYGNVSDASDAASAGCVGNAIVGDGANSSAGIGSAAGGATAVTSAQTSAVSATISADKNAADNDAADKKNSAEANQNAATKLAQQAEAMISTQERVALLKGALNAAQKIKISRLLPQPEGLSLGAFADLFNMEVGDVSNVFLTNEGYAVAYIETIEYFDAEAKNILAAQFFPAMTRFYHNLLFKEYLQQLKENLNLEINGDAINNIVRKYQKVL